ncbi:MAG: hypothetical protein IJU52_01735, partial [Clostridia bacterium]|nr:hypothetical protein [Clostridia bacterium]
SRLGFVILLDNKRSPVRTKPQKSRKTDGIPTIRFAGAAHLQANETPPFSGTIIFAPAFPLKPSVNVSRRPVKC